MRRLTTFAGVLIAMLLLPGAASASFPGGNGLIAFDSNRDGDTEIFVTTPTGGGLLQLTTNSASDTNPVFSPDGTKIAFVSNRDADNEIYVMDRDGSNQTRLTNHVGDDLEPAWSPDGTELAIRRADAGLVDVWVIDAVDGDAASGGSEQNLTNSPCGGGTCNSFYPAWSPDGTRIAFQRFRSGSGVGLGNEVMVMDADGSNQTNLTNNSNSINDGQPSWSPDGNWIAFRNNAEGNHDVYTMASNGGSVVRKSASPKHEETPFWSPDGSRVAFDRDVAADGDNPNLFSLEIDPTSADTGANLVPIAIDAGVDTNPGWESDNTEPDTEITAGIGEGEFTNEVTQEFSFTSTEANSTFECRVNAEPFDDCTSPHTTDPLAEGENTFEVRAVDVAGNADSTAASRTFTVDLTAPTATIDSAPDDPSNDTTPEFAFSSDEDPNASFECRLDEADPFEACTSTHETEELGEGEHTFEVRAIDAAGNTGPADSHTWDVDLTAPTTTIDSAPDDPSNDPTPEFTFSSDEDPNATFECRLDSTEELEFEACTSTHETEALGDGQHTFEVRAIDAAGNTGPADSHTWDVDLTAPEAEIHMGPPAFTNETDAEFTFSVVGDVDVTFECSLDGAPFTPCTSPHETVVLGEGQYTFEVRATDAADNTGPADSYQWTVDLTAPTATIDTQPSDPSNDQTPEFTFFSDEDPNASFECSLDGEPFAPCTSPHETEVLGQGDHTFEVRATDPAGNTGDPDSYQWTVDLTPPPSPGPSGGTLGAAAQSPVIDLNKALNKKRVAGTVSCPEGTCTLTKAEAKLKASGRSFKVKVKVPRTIAAGEVAKLKLAIGKAARRALRAAGKGRLILKLTLVSSNGTSASDKQKLKVKG